MAGAVTQRGGTGCFMGSRFLQYQKKQKSPPARQRLDSGWPSFQKGGATRAEFNVMWLQQRFPFRLFRVLRWTCTDLAAFTQQCAEWQTEAHKWRSNNTVRAVKFNYFNLWADDSFSQSRENKPRVMNRCFMWSCGSCRHVVHRGKKWKLPKQNNYENNIKRRGSC